MLQHLRHHLLTAETFNLNPHLRLLTPPLEDLLPPVSSKLAIICMEFHWLCPGLNFYLSKSTQIQIQQQKQCNYDFSTGGNLHIYTTFVLAPLAQIGQIHGIKHERILIFVFRLNKLLLRDF